MERERESPAPPGVTEGVTCPVVSDREESASCVCVSVFVRVFQGWGRGEGAGLRVGGGGGGLERKGVCVCLIGGVLH
jgi:hypothetical protein